MEKALESTLVEALMLFEKEEDQITTWLFHHKVQKLRSCRQRHAYKNPSAVSTTVIRIAFRDYYLVNLL